ncbi:auxin response factor 1 [Hibiscus trionum]|uniref:Auxin response factor n=1 Tax=Hibiscus trionum TaxID=183268 RepID=A0A9W7MKP3_HIBTR|nr:auxin response factor 1 [Hibiscus trionum]
MDGKRNGLKAKVPFHCSRRIIYNNGNNQGESHDMYTKLWYACAGPSVYVPRTGEKVLYFPQGHMEQVEAYIKEDGNMEMPVYNLPSMIICRVLHVELKVESGTDEIYAQLTLLPEAEQNELISMEHRNYQALPRETYLHFFSKKLTPSDIGTHGGCSIPKRHADGCLPPLDMSQETPQQELLATDLHGHKWCFRHVFRGQPKRHLLTSGWSTFVSSKKLAPEDTFVFLSGENGEFGVGVRRAMSKLLNNPSPSIISSHSMRHGILTSAFHAFSTRSMFTVYYRPWTRSSEFITPLDQYLKSAQFNCSIGTRFRMPIEGEESRVQRALGTIVGVEDVDHIRWPNSKWRCLKVKWDNPTLSSMLPERVCPWRIDPTEHTKKEPLALHQQKRARPNDASSPEFSISLMGAKYQSQSSSGVLQGQEDSDTCANQSTALRKSLPIFLPQCPGKASMQQLMHKQPEIQIPICNPFYQYTNSTAFFPYGVRDDARASTKFSVPNVDSPEWRTLEPRNEKRTSLSEPKGSHGYMLFGVNLVNGSPELPSPQVLTSSEVKRLCSTPPTSQSSVAEPSKCISSKQCNNWCSVGGNRSCTKVLKYGTAVGRSIDLYRFNGYEDLIVELDRMFDFNRSLIDGSSGWHVTYIDDDGDMMLIGDHYPWQKFQYEVRRMVIRPKEEIERPNLSTSSPSSASY